MTPNETQAEAAAMIRKALEAAELTDVKVGYTGQASYEPCDGASADFDLEDSARRVHCYRDDDGEWMIDAMDADVGCPAPAPYSHRLLIAYLTWATGQADGAFSDLAAAGKAWTR